MDLKLCCVLFTLVFLFQSIPMKKQKIIKAINCGLKQGSTKGEGDLKYESDLQQISGSSVDVDYHSNSDASSADIKYTFEKEIYMSQRHTYSSMTYSLPVRTGKHTLILKFAEMYFEKPGQRVFDIKIGQTTVIKNMDVIQKTGSKYAAHEEYLQFEVIKSDVYVNGEKITEGIKNRQLQLTFEKGKADNPIIQAIIIFHGPIQQTTKDDYDNLKKNWGAQSEMVKAKKQNQKIKQKIAMTKKKQVIVIRNDQLLIQSEQDNSGEPPKHQKFGVIRRFLMGPIGILIWTALDIFGIYFVATHVFLLFKQPQVEHKKQK